MNVMIIDGGGRGQALAEKLKPECDNLYLSPGNPGNDDTAYSTGLETTQIGQLRTYALQQKIDITIIGNDDPLAHGIVDSFQRAGLDVFGPTREQARLESDKSYAKRLAEHFNVPMGDYKAFAADEQDEALKYASLQQSWPLYIKDNGLRQGKGVTRCEDIAQVQVAIKHLAQFVIEANVTGSEASHTAFCDGKRALAVPVLVRDHKPVGDGDTGPMSGGMGTASPLPDYEPEDVMRLGERITAPLVRHLGFKGCVFAGLKGAKGQERVLEYNARLGDPETQVLMRLMKSRLLPSIIASVEGHLDQLSPNDWQWHTDKTAACIVLAAHGYPDRPEPGGQIDGLSEAGKIPGVQILHAGTAYRRDELVTNGGRVLNVVALAENPHIALANAYQAADCITFDGKTPVMRRDIGHTLLAGG